MISFTFLMKGMKIQFAIQFVPVNPAQTNKQNPPRSTRNFSTQNLSPRSVRKFSTHIFLVEVRTELLTQQYNIQILEGQNAEFQIQGLNFFNEFCLRT